jgi:hypothetical protein
MLRLLLAFCLVCVTAPALAQEYQSKELADAAREWRQQLIDSVPGCSFCSTDVSLTVGA